MNDQSEQFFIANAERVLAHIRVGTRILSLRAQGILAMVLGAGATAFALLDPDPYRLALAYGWWVLVYLPTLYFERKSHAEG